MSGREKIFNNRNDCKVFLPYWYTMAVTLRRSELPRVFQIITFVRTKSNTIAMLSVHHGHHCSGYIPSFTNIEEKYSAIEVKTNVRHCRGTEKAVFFASLLHKMQLES